MTRRQGRHGKNFNRATVTMKPGSAVGPRGAAAGRISGGSPAASPGASGAIAKLVISSVSGAKSGGGYRIVFNGNHLDGIVRVRFQVQFLGDGNYYEAECKVNSSSKGSLTVTLPSTVTLGPKLVWLDGSNISTLCLTAGHFIFSPHKKLVGAQVWKGEETLDISAALFKPKPHHEGAVAHKFYGTHDYPVCLFKSAVKAVAAKQPQPVRPTRRRRRRR